MCDVKGLELLNKITFLASRETTYNQPEKCKGCCWGRWDKMKQYCMRNPCVKEGESHA